MLANTDDMYIYICLLLKTMKACELIITRAFFRKSVVIFFLLGSWQKPWPSKAFLITFTTC